MMKSINYTLIVIAAASALSACQGQNPMKRESNPVRDYPRVSESIRTNKGLLPADRNQAPPAPPPDNTQRFCTAPFSISINGQSGTRLLKFPEDTQTSYEITITNKLNDEFEAKASEGFPNPNVFRLLKKLSDNSSVYQIAWNPGRLPVGQFTQTYNPRIEITSPALSSYCAGVANIYLDLLVEKSGDRPLVSVSSLPQTALVFGPNQQAKFSIEVEDKVANGVAPALNPFEFRREAVSGERTVINGTSALDCSAAPQAIPGTKKWKFDCTFTASALAQADVRPHLNSNTTATAVIFVSAKSNANGVSSSSRQINIKVKFEKVAAAPAAPAAGGR